MVFLSIPLVKICYTFVEDGGDYVLLYRRVRDLREDNDKTQKEIATYLNMQLTVYQRYERGERELPLWAAIKLADYYNVTLDYLVGRTEK